MTKEPMDHIESMIKEQQEVLTDLFFLAEKISFCILDVQQKMESLHKKIGRMGNYAPTVRGELRDIEEFSGASDVIDRRLPDGLIK